MQFLVLINTVFINATCIKDYLIDCIVFYVPMESISLILGQHEIR